MRVKPELLDLRKVEFGEISAYRFTSRGISPLHMGAFSATIMLYFIFAGDPHSVMQFVWFTGFVLLMGIVFLGPLFRYTLDERFKRDIGYYLYVWRDLQGMPVYAVSANAKLPPIPAAKVVLRVALGGKTKTSAVLTPTEKEVAGEMMPTWDEYPVALRYYSSETFQYQENTLTIIRLTSREIFWLYDRGIFPLEDTLTALMAGVVCAEKQLAVRDAEFQQLARYYQASVEISSKWYATILRLQELVGDLTWLSYGLLRGLADKKWVKAGEGAQRLKVLGAKRLRTLLQANEEEAKIDTEIRARVLQDAVLMESLGSVLPLSDGVADVAFGSTLAEQPPTTAGSQAA